MDKYELMDLSAQYRNKWNLSLKDPIDIISAVLHNMENVTLVFLPMPKGVNGACYRFDDEKIIFINQDDSFIRQRFTIAHEIYHLEFGSENFDFTTSKDDESEADLFAQYLLLPSISLSADNLDSKELIKLEQYYMIPHEEIVKRLEEKVEINDSRRITAKLGLNTRLYDPYTNEPISIGHYVRLAEELFDMEMISKAHKEEFLNEAYCYKMVYGEL